MSTSVDTPGGADAHEVEEGPAVGPCLGGKLPITGSVWSAGSVVQGVVPTTGESPDMYASLRDGLDAWRFCRRGVLFAFLGILQHINQLVLEGNILV